MDYKQTVEYLFNSTPVFEKVGASAYKEGLSNTLALDEHFGHPHTHFKSIHIAGTNGKGSCSHTIAAILQSAGYKVGLYTSPHLVDFRERIRVNGVCIDEQYVIDFVENERHFFEPLHPSFFELTTALAFKYFAEQKVDIAIIEVGLGGRLDCTNIITPLVSVITNISLDHTMFLGDTLAKIAKEKAGIIKHEVPVIVGEANDETRPVFERVAREHNAPIVFAEDSSDIISVKVDGLNGIDYTTTGYGNFKGALGGSYQVKNANTILHVVDLLRSSKISISTACVQKGFAEVCALTGLMGRWQTVHRQPLVVCDTGHNEGGWQYLGKQILQPECKTRRIVFGMVDDKDIDHVMNHLPTNAVYYFTRAMTHRAIPETKVQEYGKLHNLYGNCYGSVAEAYEAALSEADSKDFIFVGGSSYVVADFLEHLQQNK
ncbi:folylpolyglutamate synthase/dihydrofolate synthase family protein [uncultured Prevotella sp.]|uniref:bifunctional folylpolyglutamate synthase/dihydrofolate synthase n=1 Tax=uncultured Prevotella sp. TaxID=159272 RepID=UPI0027E3A1B8|nr:folylpolyglutamate synthase/dihydrofolate synthase family protein [uncultured Prevotella sp.]